MSELFIAISSGTVSMLGWGSADFLIKLATQKLHEFSILFWGQLIGAIPLLIYILLTSTRIVIEPARILPILGFAIIYGFAYALFYRGLSKGSVSILSPTLSAYGGAAVLVSVFFLGEILSPVRGIFLTIIFIAVILVSLDWGTLKAGSRKLSFTAGMPEILMALVIFAFWYPLWDKFLISSVSWLSDVLVLRLGMAIAFLLISIITKTSLSKGFSKADKKTPLVLLGIGIFDGIGFLAFNLGYGVTSLTSIITMISSAYSLPTIILAAIFFKEKISKLQWLGIALLISGLIMLNLFA